MGKFLRSAFAMVLAVSSLASCTQQENIKIGKAFDFMDPDIIMNKIDSLGEITDTSKVDEIFELFQDCKCLTDQEFEKIKNYGELREALDSSAQFYNEEEIKLKVMSFNIRNGEYGNGRMNLVLSKIIEESPDLIGLQEVGDDWKPFFNKNLPDEYIRLGRGREEPGRSEANYILFKKDKFELLESKTIWLTETPQFRSVWKDPETGESGFPRIATYAVLKRKSDGIVFVYVNTHLETDQPAQNHQAYWLTQYLDENFRNKYPIILTGDFNCSEGEPAYNTITDYGFKVTNTYGESTRTFTGYSDNGGAIIDFCFVNEYIPIISYKVMPDKENGQFISDHNAIISEVLLLPINN